MKKDQRVTTKQFAELCGTKANPLKIATLYTDLRRNKVIQGKDKKIDIKDAINAEYILMKKGEGKATDNRKSSEIVALEKEKKQFEMEKAREELIMSRIRRQKAEGEVIPVALVQLTFQTHFKSITQAFHNAGEQMVVDLCKRLNGKRKDIATAKGQMVLSVNDAVTKAKAMSKNELANIVEEFSESRMIGQRGRGK